MNRQQKQNLKIERSEWSNIVPVYVLANVLPQQLLWKIRTFLRNPIVTLQRWWMRWQFQQSLENQLIRVFLKIFLHDDVTGVSITLLQNKLNMESHTVRKIVKDMERYSVVYSTIDDEHYSLILGIDTFEDILWLKNQFMEKKHKDDNGECLKPSLCQDECVCHNLSDCDDVCWFDDTAAAAQYE